MKKFARERLQETIADIQNPWIWHIGMWTMVFGYSENLETMVQRWFCNQFDQGDYDAFHRDVPGRQWNPPIDDDFFIESLEKTLKNFETYVPYFPGRIYPGEAIWLCGDLYVIRDLYSPDPIIAECQATEPNYRYHHLHIINRDAVPVTVRHIWSGGLIDLISEISKIIGFDGFSSLSEIKEFLDQ